MNRKILTWLGPLLLLLVTPVDLAAQSSTQTQTISVSGQTISVPNNKGAMKGTFVYTINGSPSTISLIIQGCVANPFSCATVDTYTTVQNTTRTVTVSTAYDYFTVQGSWTGGAPAPSTYVVVVSTLQNPSTGGGGGIPGVTITNTPTTSNQITSSDSTTSASWKTPAAGGNVTGSSLTLNNVIVGNNSAAIKDSGVALATVGLTTNPLSQFAATTSSQLAATISDETGTGVLVFGTNPVLTTPNLGTPSAVNLANATNLPNSALSGTVALTTNPLSQFAATTSAQLAGIISDETGSGALVFGTSPTLTTPNLGTPSAINLTNATGLPGTALTLTDRLVTGTTDTLLAADRGNRVEYNNNSSVSVTLPQAGTGSFVSWFTRVSNEGAGVVTITPTTSTINGQASWTINTGQFCFVSVSSTGANYNADCADPQITWGANLTPTRSVNGLQVDVSGLAPAPNDLTPTTNLFANGYTQASGAWNTSQVTGNSVNGAASASAFTLTGTPFTGGTGTTNFPLSYINPSTASAVTGFSANGEMFGINVPSSVTGRAFSIWNNGGVNPTFSVVPSGTTTSAGTINAAAGSALCLNGRSCWHSGADGRINATNNANTTNGITRACFGTEATGNPCFSFDGSTTKFSTADGTGDASKGSFASAVISGNNFYCEQYASLPACVTAANNAGGGTAYVSAAAAGSAATYTITDTLIVGVNQTAKVSLRLGPGVRIVCNLTGAQIWKDCIDLADGSALAGDPSTITLAASSVTSRPIIQVKAGSKVNNIVAPLDWSGAVQQGMTVTGVSLSQENSTALVAQGLLHVVGLFSGTKLGSIDPNGLYNTIGVLIDNFDTTTFNNATNGLTVSAAGTTVTMTLPTSATADPSAHHLNWNSNITVSGCSGGTAGSPANANGNYTISNLGNGGGTLADAQTSFQYTAGASVGTGTVTGCTFTNKTPSFGTGQGITSVIQIDNIVSFGSGSSAGQRPMVITQNGGGNVGALSFTGSQNYENMANGGKAIEINGNGCSSCVQGINFAGHLHMEPLGTGTGLYIRDAFGVVVDGIDVSGGGSLAVQISQSGSNKVGGIRIGPIYNLNWTQTLVNSINGDTIDANGSNGMLTTGYVFNGGTFGGPANTLDNPEDFSQILWRDDFIGNVATASAFGLGWTSHVTNTGSINTGNGTFPNAGVAVIATGATVSSFSSLSLDKSSETIIQNPVSNGAWSNTFILQISTVTAATSRTRFGFGTAGNTANIPTNGVYFRLDTDAGINDTVWQICYDTASVETCASTGVSPNTNYNRFRMHSDTAGKVYASINGGTEVSICPSGCTATATMPSGSFAPFIQIQNDVGTNYTLNLDFWAYKQWNLAR